PSFLFLSLFLKLVERVCCLFSSDDSKLLQVTIPTAPPVFATLGGSLTLPCLVSLAHPPPSPSSAAGRHAVLSLPRVKWSVLTHGREAEILVARGDRVRVSEAYKERASLLNYARSPADLTLRLEELRHNDTGFYRCEVQQGLEDADDVVQVKVRGTGPTQHRSIYVCVLCPPCPNGPCFVHWCTVMLEEEGASSKLFPQSWECGIVQNVLFC
uniref:Ig-like domain-containing protein n=1 Tax=Sphaeramia orbicularis TaxID=375764 RepID=A0A673A7D4_9TELE